MTTIKEEENNALNMDDRLKGIAYQFLKLYERWSEDRQVLNKNMAVLEEMLKVFITQIKEFEKLESKANNQILISAEKAAKHVCSEIGVMVGKSITQEVDSSVIELKKSVNETTAILKYYQLEVKNSLWRIIGAAISGSILTSLFIVWLLIPKPTLPLTDNQIADYQNGQLFSKIWPKLSAKEQKHLKELASKSMASQNNNSTNDIADDND